MKRKTETYCQIVLWFEIVIILLLFNLPFLCQKIMHDASKPAPMTDKIQATCSPVTGNALGFLPVVGNDCPVDPSSEDEGGSELVT